MNIVNCADITLSTIVFIFCFKFCDLCLIKLNRLCCVVLNYSSLIPVIYISRFVLHNRSICDTMAENIFEKSA